MPLKTWADYERLEAADLNAAFSWSQDQTLIGAHSNVTGADTTTVAQNAYGEARHGAPAAGDDPFTIYQSANGRLVVPVGMGGLWFYSMALAGFAPTTSGDTMQAWLNIDGVRGWNMGAVSRYTGASVNAVASSVMLELTAGQVLFLEARMLSSGGQAACKRWSLFRLGRGIGSPGAVPTLAAGRPAFQPDPGNIDPPEVTP